jgi:hypothetical protein
MYTPAYVYQNGFGIFYWFIRFKRTFRCTQARCNTIRGSANKPLVLFSFLLMRGELKDGYLEPAKSILTYLESRTALDS